MTDTTTRPRTRSAYQPAAPTSTTTDPAALAGAVAAAGLPGTVYGLEPAELSDDEWRALLRLCRSEHLAGLLLAASHDSTARLQQQRREALISMHRQSMESVLLLEHAMLRTVEALTSAGAETRVLKGSAVARLDYSNPSQRPFGDIDLMVRPHEFDLALAVLRDLGFRRETQGISPRFDRRFGKGATLVDADGVYLDLHITFVQGRFGLAVDLDDLWDDAEPFVVAGRTLHALTPEARLLHATYHAVLGNWPPRLLPLRDVAEMALYGRWDDARLRRLSQRWRADSVLATGVREAWDLLGLQDSTALSTWAQEYVVPAGDRRVMALHRTRGSSYTARQLAAISALPWRERLSFALCLALPSREFLERRGTSLPQHVARVARRSLTRPSG
jgi:hypothetical protein